MQKIKGLGGVFIKTDDRERLREWYARHLGLEAETWGAVFQWREREDPSREQLTVFGLFESDTTYFEPSRHDHMLNFIVEDLDALRRQLLDGGVEVSEVTEEENGRFAWVADPDGRRVELWQPAPPPKADG